MYLRVHRRSGTQRLLSDDELDSWANRLVNVYSKMKGTIYFMWNTIYEDQSSQNAQRLMKKLPQDLIFDWKRRLDSNPGQLAYFFKKKEESEDVKQEHQNQVIENPEPKKSTTKVKNETQRKEAPKKQKKESDTKPLTSTSYFTVNKPTPTN